MTSRLLTAIRLNVAAAEASARRLDKLAEHFTATGNSMVAEKLMLIGDDIVRAADEASLAFDEDLTQRLAESRANSVNLLSAVLAGMGMGKEEGAIVV